MHTHTCTGSVRMNTTQPAKPGQPSRNDYHLLAEVCVGGDLGGSRWLGLTLQSTFTAHKVFKDAVDRQASMAQGRMLHHCKSTLSALTTRARHCVTAGDDESFVFWDARKGAKRRTFYSQEIRKRPTSRGSPIKRRIPPCVNKGRRSCRAVPFGT